MCGNTFSSSSLRGSLALAWDLGVGEDGQGVHHGGDGADGGHDDSLVGIG